MITLTRSPSVELLAEQAPPRHRVGPSSKSNSWEDVADLSRLFGVILDPWQEDVLQAAMGERSNGLWMTPQIAVSAPRQNGKSQLIVARALAGVLLFGEKLIVISAHQQDTARETFYKFTDQIDASDELASRIAKNGVMNAINREQIKFTNGAVVKFKARSFAGSRGFSSDCLLLDEAQILGARAWASIRPTMSARKNPQVWLLGTPPTPEDDSEVFSTIRNSALEGKSKSLAYLEWSSTGDPALDETRAEANPAWFTRINHEVVQGEYESMSDEQFGRERLGRWDSAGQSWIIPREFWESAGDLQSVAVDRLAVGIEAGPDLSWASIALAGQRSDGDWHVELWERKEGAAWVAPLVRQILDQNPGKVRAVVADAGSPTAALFDDLSRLKVKLTKPKVVELGTACSRLLDGIVTGSVRHTKQGQMDAAVAVAGKRPLGDTGMWVWSRKTSTADITPIQSATLALFGAQNVAVKRPGSGRTSGREAVVM